MSDGTEKRFYEGRSITVTFEAGRCPSGALQYERVDGGERSQASPA
jgi:uncharacterized Fe-S cluster protein YjdI